MLKKLIVSLIFLAGTTAQAGTVVDLPTRPDVTTRLFWAPATGATATVLLFPGAGGGFGPVVNGHAMSHNFLVRTAPNFLAHHLNVAIFGRPSDSRSLGYADRISDAHLTDVRKVIDYLKTQSSAPLWIVGTSRGTISAAATVIHLQDAAIAGLVLTSTVDSAKTAGSVPAQDLAAIRVPVLLLHHRQDSCAICRPSDLPQILDKLTRAPVKKEMMVSGGANPTGDGCSPMNWHGFIGMEAQAVDIISDWIAHPQP